MNIFSEPAVREPESRPGCVEASAVAGAVLMPHAPILVPAVARTGGRSAQASGRAMSAAARFLLKLAPESVVLISPHSPRQPGAFGLWAGERLRGSFAQFNAPHAQVDLPNDQRLIQAILSKAKAAGVETWRIQHHELDHGALVPLWFLSQAGWSGPTVVVSLNYPDEGSLAAMGEVIRLATQALHRPVGVVASGDMSHCLTPDAPCGFHPDAHLFDQTFIRLLKSGAYHSLGNINAELREHAAEDAVDSTLVAVAAAGWNAAGHKVLNYEAPFGVGYGVAILYCKRKASEDLELAKPAMDSADGNLLPGIARRAVETALGGSFDFPPAAFGEYLNSQRGVFVTLHHANGELRGCVGTIVPVCASLVAETWRNARLAALHDDRFAPVSPEEMEDLRFEVSVLHPPEQITQVSQLDPGRYGVIVSTDDGRHGLLLPGIKHIKTAEQQLHFAEAKGFISPHEPVAVRRFEVDHFLEHDESPTTH